MPLSKASAKDPDADTDSDENEATEATDAHDISTDSQDWESLTVDMELWDVLTRQYEDVMAVITLLNIPASQSSGEKNHVPISVSVSKLLNSGKGSVPEVVARYVVQQGLNPASLFFNFSVVEEDQVEEEEGEEGTDKQKKEEKKEEKKPKEVERSLEEKIHDMSQADKVKYQLGELRRKFPHSLHNDVLLANCCWEYAVVWNKDPEKTSNLEMSLEYLRLVQNAVFRQGVSSLLWHMFMMKRASAAANLMEKVGKPPKDRLCRKDVGVSDTGLVTFICLCADFMEILMDANCEANEVPMCNMEPEWQKVQGPTSLMELAIDQKATNYGLLRVHYHLLKIMSAVLALGMKSVKVLSLFDNKGRLAVFKELHSHPLLPNQKVDHDLFLARRNFLCRVITGALSTIDPPTYQSSDSISTSPVFKRQRSLYPVAFKWPQEVLVLARDFGLDLDYLKRHHVCELYSFGHDKMAEEVMLTVNDHEEMGIQLLTVAGQRVAYEIFKRDIDANFHHLAGMSTSLTRWLKTLDPEKLHFPTVPLSSTVLLVEHAATRLTESSQHHDLAQELLEKTRTLAKFSAAS